MRNLHFARGMFPELLDDSTKNAISIEAANLPTFANVGRRFVYMPQNAWAWGGAAIGFRERSRKLALSTGSRMWLSRASAIIRLCSDIPGPRGTPSCILPNVLDQDFDDLAFLAQGSAADHTAFVYVGALASYKNVHRLIDAYAEYRRAGGGLDLEIYGTPFSASYLRLIRNKAYRARATLVTSPLARADVAKVLRGSYAAVFPSLCEGSPVTLLEALAVAPRVLATEIPGHLMTAGEDLNGDCYFNGRDVGEIAHAMLAAERMSPLNVHPLRDPQERARRRCVWSESLAHFLRRLCD